MLLFNLYNFLSSAGNKGLALKSLAYNESEFLCLHMCQWHYTDIFYMQLKHTII